MMLLMTITQPTTSEVEHYGKSAEDLMKEGMFPRIHTLLSLRTDYYDLSTGIRKNVHSKPGYGERVADIVDTTDAETRSNGYLRLVYVQQPEDVSKSLRKETYSIEGGKRIICDVPQSGWQVPTSDGLWNPETGTAFATVQDRDKAVKVMKAYMEANPETFRNWEISEKSTNFWRGQVQDFDKLSDIEKLAIVETSYQWRPETNVGPRPVRRGFWYLDNGPFDVSLSGDLSHQDDCVGVRLR